MVIKTVWYWHKDRHIDQWNRIETPKINPQVYCQMDFVKGAKVIQWGKEIPRKLDIHKRKIKLDTCLKLYIKVNSKWIKDANVRPKIIKLIEESRENAT